MRLFQLFNYKQQFLKDQPKMGPVQIGRKQKLQNIHEQFRSMVIELENNKLIAEVYVGSSISLNRWASNLIKVSQVRPENILIPKESKVIENSPCGEGMLLEIEFECYYIPLSQQLAKRRQYQKYLQEAEMWYLLYCLVQSASSCHKIGTKIGDIKPQNILLNREGKLKILSKLSLPNQCDPVLDYHIKKMFLSPQQLKIINKSYKQSNLDYITSETFSIGMVMLSAGTLQSLFKCYNYEKIQLNMLQFNKIIAFWNQNEFYSEFQNKKIQYSSRLKGFINNMLNHNVQKRMPSLQIYNLLKPHQSAIMRMESFNIDYRPLSPTRKLQFPNTESNNKIHALRSKKKSLKFQSPDKKVEESQEIKGTLNTALQFSFRSPQTEKKTQITKLKSNQETKSPIHRIKLANSFNVLNDIK